MSTSADSGRLAIKACCFSCGLLILLLAVPGAFGQLPGQKAYALLQQQSNKLVGTGATGASQQGNSVAISADGNTAIVGAPLDNSNVGGAWIFTQANGVWSQQGTELVGTRAIGAAQQGWSVAISGDGNTALLGGPGDHGGIGAAWVFTRSGGAWTQQSELVGAPGAAAAQGSSVAISGDGNTAALGADNLNSGAGGIFVFTRNGGNWSQQGSALTVTAFGETGAGQFGYSLAMSLDGNKILGGANLDNSGAGAAWMFKRSAGVWSIGSGRLLGGGATGNANQGSAVAISGDGNVLATGGPLDSSGAGAFWIFTFQVDHFGAAGGQMTVSSSDGVGNSGLGTSLALSRDGSVLVAGGPGDNGNNGAVWQFGRTGLTAWTQKGTKLVPSDESSGANAGASVALSADGNTGFFGATQEGSGAGAGWPFDTNVNLGSTNVGSNATKNIALQVQNGFTVGGVTVVTQGARNLDFTAASSQPSSGVCHAISILSAGSTCSINIEFAPTAAGLRLGAVLMFDGSDVLQATVFLHGIGLSPVVSFSNPEIDTVVGDGTYNSSGDGGPALAAELKSPFGVTVDSGSDLYINDFDAANVRFVDEQLSAVTALGVTVQAGNIQTVVGNGTRGFSGDAGAATLAEINQSEQLALDGAGNLYIADVRNNRIRKVDARTGTISTVAGGGGSLADGVLATNANTDTPQGVVVTPNGDIILSDTRGTDNKVHRVAATTGIITTIAGTSTQGFGGDGGPATSAAFFGPLALAIDPQGNLYVDDDGNNVIRKVSYATGTITTVAGTPGPTGFSGDGGLATSAGLNDPEGLSVDAAGDIYITDSSNNVVRVVSAFTGVINTIAGSTTTNTGFSGDGGPAINAFFNYPAYPTLDSAGNFYVSDNGNSVVRKIGGSAPLAFASTMAGSTSAAQDVTVTNNGTGALILTNLMVSANYDVQGSDTTCTVATTLNPGDSCVLGIEFSPIVAGSIPGSVTLVDNAGSQIVSMSGTGLLTSTTTVVTTSPNPAGQGQSVTLTATVTPSPMGLPLGTVTFSNGSTSLGSGNVNSSGVATLVTLTLPVGIDSITASYSGNAGFDVSTSAPVTVTVNPVAVTTTTLSESPSPATFGQSVTLTATITPAPTGSSLGTVTFFNGTTQIGTATPNSSGVATFTISSLPGGALNLTANYSGNTGSGSSTSSVSALTVNTTYAVTPAQTSYSVSQAASVSISVTVPPLGGAFNGVVTMSATGLPPGATAAFVPPTVTPGSAGATTMLTIQLASGIVRVNWPDSYRPATRFALKLSNDSLTAASQIILLLVSMMLIVLWTRGVGTPARQLRGALLLAALTAFGLALAGCANTLPRISPITSATPAGNYVVTIIGTSGSSQVTSTVTIAVQ